MYFDMIKRHSQTKGNFLPYNSKADVILLDGLLVGKNQHMNKTSVVKMRMLH